MPSSDEVQLLFAHNEGLPQVAPVLVLAVLLGAVGAFAYGMRKNSVAAVLLGLSCSAIISTGWRLAHSQFETAAGPAPLLAPSCWEESAPSDDNIVVLDGLEGFAFVGAGDFENVPDFSQCSAARVSMNGLEAVARIGRPVPPNAAALIASAERINDRAWLELPGDETATRRFVTVIEPWYVEIQLSPSDGESLGPGSTDPSSEVRRTLGDLSDITVDQQGHVVPDEEWPFQSDRSLLTDWLMQGAPRYRIEYGRGGTITMGVDEVSVDLDTFLTVDTYACGTPTGHELASRSDDWKPVDGVADTWILEERSMNVILTGQGCSLVVISSPLGRDESIDLLKLASASDRSDVPAVDLLAAPGAAEIQVTEVQEGGLSPFASVAIFAGPLVAMALLLYGIIFLIRRRQKD